LSADKLLLSNKGKEGVTEENSKLKIKWDQEVNHVYAGFSELMNIKKVDITKGDYQNNLNNDKDINDKSELNVKIVNNQIECNTVADSFSNVIQSGTVNLSNLRGDFCLFQFNSDNIYHTAIAPVGIMEFPKGLICISQCFEPKNIKGAPIYSITIDSKFWKKYFWNPLGGSKLIYQRVFFLMHSNQPFPDISESRGASIFVLNEIKGPDNKTSLYLLKRNSRDLTKSIKIDDNIYTGEFKKDDFIHKIQIIQCRRFKPEIKNWKSLNYGTEYDLGRNDFSYTLPKFLEDKKTNELVRNLQNLIKK
jgi:hypothetical protein